MGDKVPISRQFLKYSDVFLWKAGVNILTFNLYFIREKFLQKKLLGKSFQPPKAVGKIQPREEPSSAEGGWQFLFYLREEFRPQIGLIPKIFHREEFPYSQG